MSEPTRSLAERWTYADYRSWPDEERWELIRGAAYSMSPAPKLRHQRLVGRLFSRLFNFLADRPCEVFVAPLDVLLPEGDEPDDEVDTVVQPDISVFCDRSKLTEAGARGAPDIVVEVLSPSTSKKDQREKFDLYEKRGLREYWVVDPVGAWLCVYRRREDGRFDEGELRERLREYGPISSIVLEGFSVDPAELFADLD